MSAPEGRWSSEDNPGATVEVALMPPLSVRPVVERPNDYIPALILIKCERRHLEAVQRMLHHYMEDRWYGRRG